MTTSRTHLLDFLARTKLEKSLLLGYYGGGNYGDELLLEVLGNLLRSRGVSDVTIAYQQPHRYLHMHHDFGYRLVNVHSKRQLLRATLRSRNILVGGGGLWGVDINRNTLLMSLFLWLSRWLLGKKIYLLGVGYYRSTSWQGRLAAWLAAKAARTIIARDPESVANFRRLSRHVQSDRDIAWYSQHINLASYRHEVDQLDSQLPVTGKTLLVSLRRPQAHAQHDEFARYNRLVGQLIAANLRRPIIIALLETESKAPDLYEQARSLRRRHRHLRLLEAPYNPLALFCYLQRHRRKLAVVAPQLHLMLTAHLHTIPCMPMVYDNKVRELLTAIAVPAEQQLPLAAVTQANLQTFVDHFFEGGKS